VRSLSVNRKPLRNCRSLAYPPAFGNGVTFFCAFLVRLPFESNAFQLRGFAVAKAIQFILSFRPEKHCRVRSGIFFGTEGFKDSNAGF